MQKKKILLTLIFITLCIASVAPHDAYAGQEPCGSPATWNYQLLRTFAGYNKGNHHVSAMEACHNNLGNVPGAACFDGFTRNGQNAAHLCAPW